MAAGKRGFTVMMKKYFILSFSLLTMFLFAAEPAIQGNKKNPDEKSVQRAYDQKNYLDAFNMAEKLLFSRPANAEPEKARKIFDIAMQSLAELGRYDDQAELVKKIRQHFPGNYPLLLRTVARLNSYGYIIGGVFHRGGNYVSGAEAANSRERDRVEDLILLLSFRPLVEEKRFAGYRSEYFNKLFNVLSRDGNMLTLHSLTDLDKIPEIERGNAYAGNQRFPLDKNGNVIFSAAPEKFSGAESDMERLLYCRDKMGKDSDLWSNFLQNSFSVYRNYYRVQRLASTPEGRQLLRNLKDDETLLWLNGALRKVKLPADYALIPLLERKKDYHNLYDEYYARLRFEKAAEVAGKALKAGGSNKYWQEKLDDIVSNRGFFEHSLQEFDKPAVTLIYRNSPSVKISVHPIALDKLIDTIVKDRGRVNRDGKYRISSPEMLASVLKDKRYQQFIGDPVETSDIRLSPWPNHEISRSRIAMPVEETGYYLVKALFPGGAECMVPLMVSNMSISLLKDRGNRNILLLNDSKTGKPLAGQKVNFYGFRQKYNRDPRAAVTVDTCDFEAVTDAEGKIVLDQEDKLNYSYLVYTSAGKNPGFLGFYLSKNMPRQFRSDDVRYFPIFSQGVYRPGDKVKFTVYARTSRYGDNPLPDLKSKKYEIISPRGKKLWSKELAYDRESGCFQGEWEIPADAELGAYRLSYLGTFRVEEFRKPEYSLSVTTPSPAVKQGGNIDFTVKGAYYFGGAVSNGKITYSLSRRTVPEKPFWIGPFDWLFGAGYWRYSSCRIAEIYDYSLYEDVEIASGEGMTDSNGEFHLSVPTEKKKENNPVEYTYTLSATLTDESNFAVSASGSAAAVPENFRVYLRAMRGWLRAGKTIEFEIAASRPGQGMIAGNAEVSIYREKLDDSGNLRPDRSKVLWKKELELPADTVSFPLVINEPGNYLVEAKVTDKNNISATGRWSLQVMDGDEKNIFSSQVVSSAPLELTADKSTYVPGETAQILLTVQKPGMTVYLRSSNAGTEKGKAGDYVRYELDNATSMVLPVKLAVEDQPNIFVDAFAVCDGKFYQARKEVLIPPEDKSLKVEVTPAEPQAEPGNTGKIKIRVTLPDGKPAGGYCTVTIYDKSLDYIASGYIPEILQFFWGFKNYFKEGVFNNLGIFYPAAPTEYEVFRYIYPHYSRGRRNANVMFANGTLREESAPMLAKATAADKADAVADAAVSEAQQGDAGGLRSNFADSILWAGCSKLNENGELFLEVKLPDNLTTWRIRCWSLDPVNRVGSGESEIVVSKKLLARLQLPRFLVTGDKAAVSGIVHNYSDETLTVIPRLLAKGDGARVLSLPDKVLTIEPGKSVKCDFEVMAVAPGEADFILEAKAENSPLSDALQLKFPVLVRGVPVYRYASGSLTGTAENCFVNFVLPAERKLSSGRLQVEFSPSLAATLTDLLPYLGAEDTGDVFGIVNRFVPALSVKYALAKLGVDMSKIKGKSTPDELLENYLRGGRQVPVFDGGKMEKVISENLKMIESYQNADGGWGWFGSLNQMSFLDTTLYVTQSLLAAKAAGLPVDKARLDRALKYLRNQEKQLDAKSYFYRAWMFAVLAEGGDYDEKVLGDSYENREKLPLYLLALMGEKLHPGEKRSLIGENLRQYLKYNRENQTAHLERNALYRCFWYGDDSVIQSAYLNYLLSCEPENPVIPMVVKYLVENLRYAPSVNSSMALAQGVRALARYLQISGEGTENMTASVLLNGKELGKIEFTPENRFDGAVVLAVNEPELKSGNQVLEIRRQGGGTLYFSASMEYFSLEDKFPPAGNEIKLSRRYYKIDKISAPRRVFEFGEWREQPFWLEKRTEITGRTQVRAGDIIEVELYGNAANDYDYIRFADRKIAGLETEKNKSSYISFYPLIYAEYRPEETVFYWRNVRRGEFSMRYRLRAVFDGVFCALPAEGRGMYVPQLRANTGEFNLKIGR